MTIYLATGLTAGEATPMDDERIETTWFTAKEIDAMIALGQNPRREDQHRLPEMEALLLALSLAQISEHRSERLRAMAHRHLLLDRRFAEGAAEGFVEE